MSQSETVDTLNYISNQIYIYGYSFILVAGLFGNTINIIMFATKLKESVCSLYLLVSDISNHICILLYILPAILQQIFGRNGTESSLPWCKLTNYTGDVCLLISTWTLCLASVDRYLCSSRQVSDRQWSSRKVAKVIIIIIIVCSLSLGIPDLLYWYIDNVHHRCTVVQIYQIYVTYFLVPVMLTVIPLLILSVAGYKTYRNLRVTIHPVEFTTPNTRRQGMDNQLARMLLLQILCFLFQTMIFFMINLYITVTLDWQMSDMQLAIQNLLTAIAFVIYNTCMFTSFYIYYFQSPTYRAGVNNMLTIKIRQRNGQPVHIK